MTWLSALRFLQPFAERPVRQPSLSIDPVWAELLNQEREAQRQHKRVNSIRRAKRARVHELLRGRG